MTITAAALACVGLGFAAWLVAIVGYALRYDRTIRRGE